MAEQSDFAAQTGRQAARLDREAGTRVFAQLADAYRQEGLLEEAIRICREGLATHPGYVNGRMVLGQALMDRGALEEAAGEFQRLLELAPDNLLAWQLLGDVLARRGQAGEARRCYDQVLRLNPQEREVQARLAALSPQPMPGPAPGGEPGPALAPVATISLEVPGAPVTAREAALGISLDEPGMAGPVTERVPSADTGYDPLASPTLAALYAAQGHAAEAEAIYARIDREVGREPAVPSPEGRRRLVPHEIVLQRLSALREAARRLREAGEG